MNNAFVDAIRAFGTRMSPDMVGGTCKLLAAQIPADFAAGLQVDRNLAYGTDARQVMDVFRQPSGSQRPVLLFVHGGGFVGGDRTMMPGSPFYDNIAQWAAHQGYVGVNMTYRLAPAHRWPTGSDDVASAVAWWRQHAAEFGGNPEAIFLMGQSAGSVHVADYLARGETAAAARESLAGAMLISCIYDAGSSEQNKLQKAYFGDDPATWSRCSALPGLLTSTVPMLMAVAEFDIPDFQTQAATLVAQWLATHGTYPPLLRLTGHNHLSTILQLGTADDTLGGELRLFMEQHSKSRG